MARLEHRPKDVSPPHPPEEGHDGVGESLAIADEHTAEVVLLQMLPHAFDIVELFRGIGRKPEDSNAVLDAFDLCEASLGLVGRAVVQYQDNALAGPASSRFEHLDHSDEQARVDALGSVGEYEGAIGPAVCPADSDSGILAGGRDSHRLAPSPVRVRRDREEFESDPVREPEFVIGLRLQSPFFSRRRAFCVRFVAVRFWRFRMVRLVLRQTIPCIRSSSEIHSGVSQTSVCSPMYSAKRGAVQRVNAYPKSRGSRSTTRTRSRTYTASASGGRPARGASASPKCRRSSQRCFQLTKVARVIDNPCTIFLRGTCAASINRATIRSRTRLEQAVPSCRLSAALSEVVKRISTAVGMDSFPSLLREEVYHAV